MFMNDLSLKHCQIYHRKHGGRHPGLDINDTVLNVTDSFVKGFCIVNKTKTKMLCFGKQITPNVYFNNMFIEKDDHYRYLGNEVRSVRKCNQDIFFRNFTHLSDQSRKALFNLRKKIKCLGYSISLALIFSIKSSCNIQVKGTTCNDVVTGKSGKFPPGVYCHNNVLCYHQRLLIMQGNRVVKSAFKALLNVNDHSFNTWMTRLCELANYYKINFDKATDLCPKPFKLSCAEIVKNDFINR